MSFPDSSAFLAHTCSAEDSGDLDELDGNFAGFHLG